MVFLSGFGHEWEGFRPSFSNSRLCAMGPAWDEIVCERFEELLDSLLVEPGATIYFSEEVLPLPEGVNRAFEADALERGVEAHGGTLHEAPDEVVCNGMHGDLFADHLSAFASEYVHAEGRLDMAEEEFDVPSAHVESGELGSGVCDGVGKRGDDDEGSGSEARDFNGDEDVSNAKRCG